jgi:biotin carboxyl carrier protein
MKYRIEQAGQSMVVDVEVRGELCIVRTEGGPAHEIRLETRADGSQRALTPWGELELHSARRGSELWAHVAGRRLRAEVTRARTTGAGSATDVARGAVCAPMPGRLLRVDVKVGDPVRAGQPLAVIEAMKMENELVSPFDGVVTQVAREAPTTVDKGDVIVRVEPS